MGPASYYSTVAASAFAVVVFGAGLVGSRLISLAERAAFINRERGDFLNQKVSAAPSPQGSWAERGRRNELADLHLLVARLRRSVGVPLAIALVTGLAALVPFLGWPKDSTTYRLIVLFGLLVSFSLWIQMLLGLVSDVLIFTTSSHDQRAKERRDATEAGASYLVSGDPAALDEAAKRIDRLVPWPAWWHPIARLDRWRSLRRTRRAPHHGV